MICLKLGVKYIHAKFSAIRNRWHIMLLLTNRERLEFGVRYIIIEGYEDKEGRRVAATIQDIKADGVKLSLGIDTVKIKSWKRIKKSGVELWNPDKPRNLAKTVTVK